VTRRTWRVNQGEKQRYGVEEDAMENLFMTFLFDVT
jgi:hypothetical protein